MLCLLFAFNVVGLLPSTPSEDIIDLFSLRFANVLRTAFNWLLTSFAFKLEKNGCVWRTTASHFAAVRPACRSFWYTFSTSSIMCLRSSLVVLRLILAKALMNGADSIWTKTPVLECDLKQNLKPSHFECRIGTLDLWRSYNLRSPICIQASTLNNVKRQEDSNIWTYRIMCMQEHNFKLNCTQSKSMNSLWKFHRVEHICSSINCAHPNVGSRTNIDETYEK